MPSVATPSQDARQKRPRRPASGHHIDRPAHSTSRTRRRTGRGGWRAVFRSSPRLPARRPSWPRCPVLPVMSVAVPSHIARRGGISGRRQFPGHIFRAVFPSSSRPPRLIVSSATRPAVPIRAGGQRHRLIPFSWRYRGGVFFFISSSHRSPRLVISSGVSKQRSHGTGLAIRIRFNNENIRQANRRAAGGISPAHPAHPSPSLPSCRIAGRGASRPPSAHRSGPVVPISRGGRCLLSSKHAREHNDDKTRRETLGTAPSSRQASRQATPSPSRPSPHLVPSCRAGGATSPTQGTAAILMAPSSAR